MLSADGNKGGRKVETIELLVLFGIPAAITGLCVWWFKRKVEENDRKRQEHDTNMENLVLMMLQSTRANTILCKATAEAVRDGHCNGNMTAAMEVIEKAEAAEKEFLLEKGIKYIFE